MFSKKKMKKRQIWYKVVKTEVMKKCMYEDADFALSRFPAKAVLRWRICPYDASEC